MTVDDITVNDADGLVEHLTDPSGMVLHLPQENKEYNEIWATFCKEARAASPLFNTLYTLLENSPTVFNVRFEPITTSDGKPRAGRFVPADDGDGGNIMISPSEEISSSTVFEECFHAYQQDIADEYDYGDFNREFEAKTFVTIAGLESFGFPTFNGMDEFQDNIITGKYSNKNISIGLNVFSTIFLKDYLIYAGKYCRYNKTHNYGNANYKTRTNIPPKAIQNIIKRTYGH